MSALTKSEMKFVKTLGDVKGRRESGCFKAEGTKCVLDTIDSFELESLYATDAWIKRNAAAGRRNVITVTRADLERMTSLSTAPEVIAVYRIPQRTYDPASAVDGLILALDTIQDPGNLGTIMRIADWFGIHTIICSRETVDIYNPKTVQSTMGAISRVSVTYHDLPAALSQLRGQGVEVCGTFLGGENIYAPSTPLPATGVIVVGNEGKGISPEVAATVTRRLTIPSYPPGEQTSESLNAAVATAITVATFRHPL